MVFVVDHWGIEPHILRPIKISLVGIVPTIPVIRATVLNYASEATRLKPILMDDCFQSLPVYGNPHILTTIFYDALPRLS